MGPRYYRKTPTRLSSCLPFSQSGQPIMIFRLSLLRLEEYGRQGWAKMIQAAAFQSPLPRFFPVIPCMPFSQVDIWAGSLRRARQAYAACHLPARPALLLHLSTNFLHLRRCYSNFGTGGSNPHVRGYLSNKCIIGISPGNVGANHKCVSSYANDVHSRFVARGS